MKKKLVKELMVPLAKYASVSQEATLFEAVLALEKAQEKFDQSRYRHRAVLIYDNDEENIVGKVSQLDVMRALEPKYEAMGIPGSLTRFGLTKRFQETMLEELRFWDKPMDDICRKASRIKIRSVQGIAGRVVPCQAVPAGVAGDMVRHKDPIAR